MGGSSRISGRLRPPALRLGLAIHALLAVAALALLAALAMPRYGAGFVDKGALITATSRSGSPVLIADQTPVTLHGGNEALTVPAAALVNDYAPSGGPADVRAFYAARDRIGALAAQPGATLSFTAAGHAHTLPLARRHATLADLPADVWLLLAQAVAIGALGAWMAASAPGHRPARLFAASCTGVTVAALSGAVFDARELTGPGTLLQAMQALNFIGTKGLTRDNRIERYRVCSRIGLDDLALI